MALHLKELSKMVAVELKGTKGIDWWGFEERENTIDYTGVLCTDDESGPFRAVKIVALGVDGFLYRSPASTEEALRTAVLEAVRLLSSGVSGKTVVVR